MMKERKIASDKDKEQSLAQMKIRKSFDSPNMLQCKDYYINDLN